MYGELNKQTIDEQWSNMLINLTNNAIEHIKKLYKSNPEKVILFSMKKTGCSGFEYDVSLVNVSNDIELQTHSNLVVGIKKEYLDKFDGTIIDYITDKFESKFVFSNPNVVSACGCGISVSF